MIHFTIAVATGGVAWGLFFASINGEPQPVAVPLPASFTVAAVMYGVLASTYRQLWTMLEPMPEFLQTLLFASNSVLWGGVLSAIIGLARRRRPNGHA